MNALTRGASTSQRPNCVLDVFTCLLLVLRQGYKFVIRSELHCKLGVQMTFSVSDGKAYFSSRKSNRRVKSTRYCVDLHFLTTTESSCRFNTLFFLVKHLWSFFHLFSNHFAFKYDNNRTHALVLCTVRYLIDWTGLLKLNQHRDRTNKLKNDTDRNEPIYFTIK